MVKTGNVDWRSVTKQIKVRIPNWLKEAQDFKLKIPSAWRIVGLARNIQSELRMQVLLGREGIKKSGLVARLGNISRTEAFSTLIKVAEAGKQKETLTLSLEDAVSFMKKQMPMNVKQLAEIFNIRNCCSELALAEVSIVLENNEPFHELNGVRIARIMENLDKKLGDRTLSLVISEWAKEGWEVFHDQETGNYTLAQIVDDIVG